MKNIRIVLADDHSVVRQGIRKLLAQNEGMEVVGEASNGLEALTLVQETKPDVLVLDIEMPLMNGIEVARNLKNQHSATRVLILSAYDELEYILELLANGANGYLLKENAPKQLVSAIRKVAGNEQAWSEKRVSDRLKTLRTNMNYQPTITILELDLLKAYAAHDSIDAAAQTVHLSPAEAERVIEGMRRRFWVQSNDELLGYALSLGWISSRNGNFPIEEG
jgi:DNA-binding NarL/FixJ family response regulator